MDANLIAVPFRTNIAPGATVVLISHRLDFAFYVRAVWLRMDAGATDLLTAEFFVSEDPGADTAGNTLGRSFFAAYSDTATLTGDDQPLTLKHSLHSPAQSAWLKIRLINSDILPHPVQTVVMIEPSDEKQTIRRGD